MTEIETPGGPGAPSWDNLSDPIFHYAQTRPDAPALVEGQEALNYRAVAQLVAKASVYLRDLGIAQGVRVGIALTNSIDHVILLWALLRVGATVIELTSDDGPETLAATARKYGIRIVFTEPHAVPPSGIERQRIDVTWRSRLAAKSGDYRASAGADALEIISLTTGSTGLPSGVIWTQRQYMQRIALRLAIYYPGQLAVERPADQLLTGSMRFGWFFICALMQLAAGGKLVLVPEASRPGELMRTIAAWDHALVCVTANMCRSFIAAAPAEGLLFPRLYLLESAGLPLFADEKRAVLTRVAANFLECYGTAGIGTISQLRPAEMMRKAESVGRPLPMLETQIVGDDDRPLPAGRFGKIRCRGALMSRPCPENAGERSSEYFRDGWYYPGDIGSLDAEGYIQLRGRIADVIRRGSGEVYAAEVEAALASHPGVAEAAVLGLPIGDSGHAIVAFVVMRDGQLAHEALVAHCRARLTPDRWPDEVYYAEELPRISGGKVDRLRLLERAAEQMAKAAPRPSA